MTMVLIATQTVGSGGAGSIDFTSIPQTYTDLLVKVSGRDGRASNGGFLYLRFNGSTSGYGNSRSLANNANSVSNDLYTTGNRISCWFMNNGSNSTANTFSNAEIYIPNYSSTTINKSISAEGGSDNSAAQAFMGMTAASWNSTAAITQLTLFPTDSTNFQQNSIASLYGILKGSGGATVS